MRHSMSLLLVALLLVPVARADDVTMKNGKVYTNLTLQKETKSAYIYLTHEGRKMTLPKARVKSVEKKPAVSCSRAPRKSASAMPTLFASSVSGPSNKA